MSATSYVGSCVNWPIGIPSSVTHMIIGLEPQRGGIVKPGTCVLSALRGLKHRRLTEAQGAVRLGPAVAGLIRYRGGWPAGEEHPIDGKMYVGSIEF